MTLTLGVGLGILGLLVLNTELWVDRWEHRRGGLRVRRLYGWFAMVVSLLLIASAGDDLLDVPRWLSVVLLIVQFACIGGGLWLWRAASRARS